MSAASQIGAADMGDILDSLYCRIVATIGLSCAVACGDPSEPEWEDIPGFPEDAGYLASVWGTGPDDVFIAGGKESGEIYHFDGAGWETMSVPADAGLLIWVFGFAPDDVYAVGVAGTLLHYDGQSWSALDAGTEEDLWGVWGRSPTDLWIVGGSISTTDVVMLHFDGDEFENVEIESSENPMGARSLFKVWGIGEKTFAVGQAGLILEYSEGVWQRIAAGENADQDFISLWGTSEDNIVFVGGRGSSRVAVFDGTSIETLQPEGFAGTSAVYTVSPDRALVGGLPGYIGVFDVADRTLTKTASTEQEIHAIWHDGKDTAYAVGGLALPPFLHVAKRLVE